MEFLNLLHPALKEHPRSQAFASLHGLYSRIEQAQASFKASFVQASQAGGADSGLGCPGGCGSCCEGFVPDILPLEAEFLAAWLLSHRPELVAAGAPLEAPPPCPFYDPDQPAAHCRVYPARPLVCRLFAFAVSRDKEGRPAFALCRRMPEIPGIAGRAWSGEELLALGGEEPPIMSDYASELLALDPEGAGQRASMAEALEAALGKLGLAMRYALAEVEAPASPFWSGAKNEGSDDEPEPNAPAPRAA